MILVIDNFDSFTYNLVALLRLSGEKTYVLRNNYDGNISESIHFKGIVISPGPGGPEESGISLKIVETFKSQIPVLGICLGMQVMAHLSKIPVVRGGVPVHGKTSKITHDGLGVFQNLIQGIKVMRYHSLVLDQQEFPHPDWVVSATTEHGTIMGIRSKKFNLEAVQFHPESILTDNGPIMIQNWLKTLK
jgi:para-aminobenzoate synthetase component 2